jgi:hypothetical protein
VKLASGGGPPGVCDALMHNQCSAARALRGW